MPAYRVEVSPNNRAGCQDGLCKKNGDKIMKGEIRFGVWVEGTSGVGHEFQGFRWRHWGCVSGKTLQNIRENLTGPLADEGKYNWDMLDGLEDMPSHYQDKIKLAITEGKIADEDWKGDPAYNVLGKTGIRGRAAPKKKESEEGEEGAKNAAAAETPAKPAVKKRSRAKDEDEDEEAKPIKKRAVKSKKEDDEEDESQPAKKSRAKKAAKKEDDEEEDEPIPVKKPRARKFAKKEREVDEAESMMKEQDDEMDVDMKPARKPRAKKGVKEGDTEVAGIQKQETDETTIDAKPTRKARGKKATKEESTNESQVKMEGNEDANIDAKPTKKARGKKVSKKEEADDGSYLKKEENEDDAEDVKSVLKHGKHDGINGMKKEEDQVVKFDAGENHTTSSENAENTYKAEMPEDPLEQIASAFCDRDGPLVSDFNEMVEAQEIAGNDWEGFLQKKFRTMVDASEIADDDFNGFLLKMHEREAAFKEPAPIAPKRGRKGKNVSTTAAKPRASRGKAS